MVGDTQGDHCTIHSLEGPRASQCPIKMTLEKGKRVSKQGLTSTTSKTYPAHTVKRQKSGNENVGTTRLEF